MQLSLGVEMEAYGVQAAANFSASLARSQVVSLVITNLEWYN